MGRTEFGGWLSVGIAGVGGLWLWWYGSDWMLMWRTMGPRVGGYMAGLWVSGVALGYWLSKWRPELRRPEWTRPSSDIRFVELRSRLSRKKQVCPESVNLESEYCAFLK